MITRENMVVLYQAPDKAGLSHPTVEQIQAVIDAVANAEIEQEAGEDIPTQFLDPTTLKGSGNAKITEGQYGSRTFTLSNGLRVWLLPTDHEKDNILINISQEGGRSLLSDEELYSFDSNIWSLYLQNSGIAEFPKTVVNKMLAGKQLSVSPFVDEYYHGVSARTTAKDLEDALQILYLYYTQPRFDANEYNQGISQIEAVLPNLMEQSNYKISEALYNKAYDSPRRFMISTETLKKASLATLESSYKKLFKDAADAKLVIVGDFDPDQILPLVRKYGGSLPVGKQATQASYRNDGFTTRNVEYDFKTSMATPMVTVAQIYNRVAPYSVEADAACDALSNLLFMIYTETLREDEGGTYGARTNVQVTNKPDERRVLQVVFQTNVDSADKLRDLAKSGFRKVAENGPDAEQFDKVVKNLQKNIPEDRQHNNYWSNVLIRGIRYGGDYDKAYEAAVNALTPGKVQQMARELLDGNLIELVMRPE